MPRRQAKNRALDRYAVSIDCGSRHKHADAMRSYDLQTASVRACPQALLVDQEFFAIEARDPARRLATAGPRATALRVTILRRNPGARTSGFHVLGCAATAEFSERDAVVGHFLLDLIQHFCVFTRLRFFDLLFELLALREEFL